MKTATPIAVPAGMPAAASPPVAAPVLEVRDLHVTFRAPAGDVHALRGASLQIAPGEIVGLVGESGSGKSVLGLAALGLLPSDPTPVLSGSVLLDGIDMTTAGEDERRARRGAFIGAVFQDPMSSLNPAMRVGRQVAEAAGDDDRERVHQLLADTGIPEPDVKARCYPHELSGGLRQRVMIAMALARSPRLIVADEPTTALDVTVQAKVLDLLATAARERDVAMLLVTHDLGVAARVCDRIAVAYAGRIVETGRAAAVLGGPRHPYTVGLLASRPRLDGTIAGGDLPTLPGRPPDPRMPPIGCAFAPRCPAADAQCDTAVPVHLASGRRDECHHPGILGRWPEGGPHVGTPSRLLLVAPTPADAPAMVRAVPPEPALIVSGAVKEFARPKAHLFAARPEPLRAVDGVSLQVPAGGSLALVGESGSGKSTLLRMVVGLVEPTAGSISVGTGAPPQMIFQDAGASLTPWMPIGELIAERLAALGVPKEERTARVHATLEAVGLPVEAATAVPRKLSGGQRQRAAIARAIAVPPALLACDEPVSALDVSLAAQVLNLLCHLRQTLGIALLFVTHDLAAARAVADDVAVMQRGQIVEYAPASQLFAAPAHEYTRDLLAAVPDIAEVT
ncbi:MAG: Oligopeptide/dipeptide transporter, ATP-binding protein-like protein [Solirubrobacterales bacterium]|nr:Oligopeptide/dipeptide transporter, ATP-binding protein-like protein [Solirubrobacterales bacterium]